jgi:methionine-rich copper-binding protein CopC
LARQLYSVILITLGLVLTLFGLFDLLVPRARFVNSNPPAGTVIAEAPSVVSVTFSNKLASGSRMNVTSTIKLLPSGEQEFLNGGSVVLKSEIDPADQSGRTMRAQLQPDLHKGLYFINWTAETSGWGTISNGQTTFGVGMEIPEHITRDMGGVIREHNYQYRGRRAAFVGGVILLVLGLGLRAKSKELRAKSKELRAKR